MRTRFVAITSLAVLALATPASAAHHKVRIPHPRGSTLYRLPRIPSPNPSGHLHLEFDSEFTPATIQAVETEILPYVEKEFGRPWQNVDVKLYGPSKFSDPGYGGETEAACENQVVAHTTTTVEDPASLQEIGEELQHSLHGCFQFHDERFEESLTSAATTMIQQRFGLYQYPCEAEECRNLRLPGSDNPALAGGELFNHETTVALGPQRLVLGGMAFIQYELGHPGFFFRFNAAMCAETFHIQREQGGHVHIAVSSTKTLQQVALALNIAKKVDSDFGRWFAQQAIFAPRPHGDALIIVPRQGGVQFIAVHRISETETAIPNLPISLTIQGGSGYSFSTTVSTGETGTVEVQHLPESARGYLTVTATAPGGLSDTYSYYNIYLGS